MNEPLVMALQNHFFRIRISEKAFFSRECHLKYSKNNPEIKADFFYKTNNKIETFFKLQF